MVLILPFYSLQHNITSIKESFVSFFNKGLRVCAVKDKKHFPLGLAHDFLQVLHFNLRPNPLLLHTRSYYIIVCAII